MKHFVLAFCLLLGIAHPSTFGQVFQGAVNGTFGCPTAVLTVAGNTETIAEEITPEITDLAKNLENDPVRIYYYVHNYIKYVHYFGCKKGALLTLLEGSGNDFDQCSLLVSLLRAAAQNLGTPGVYVASYQFGLMAIPFDDANSQMTIRNWIGIKKSLNGQNFAAQAPCRSLLDELNKQRGYPNFPRANREDRYVLFKWLPGIGDYDYQNLIMHRVWVKLRYTAPNGATYCLDPAFKVSRYVAGIDLTASMGLSLPELETAVRQQRDPIPPATVGAMPEVTADYCRNLNWDKLSTKLSAYTSSLVQDFQGNVHKNLSMEQVLGGFVRDSRDYSASTTLPQGLPFPPIETPFKAWATRPTDTDVNYVDEDIPVLEWANIPVNYISKLKLDEMDFFTAGTGLHFSYNIPTLKARKLTITFDQGQAQTLASLDDIQVAHGDVSRNPGLTAKIRTQISHPFGNWNYTTRSVDANSRSLYNDGVNGEGKTYLRGTSDNASRFAILYSFDDPSALYRRRQEMLEKLIREGRQSGDHNVITETLNIVGLAYLQQMYLGRGMVAKPADVLPCYHHCVGRTVQSSAAGAAYWIDFELVSDVSFWTGGSHTATQAGALLGPTYDNDFAAGLFGSAMEHGVLEQLQDNTCLSSIKALYLANNEGQKLILVTPQNKTSAQTWLNQETLRTFTSTEIATILDSISAGDKALIPSGKCSYGNRTGYGWVDVFNANFVYQVKLPIDGGLNGGYAGFVKPLDGYYSNERFLYAPDRFSFTPPAVTPLFGADPVNLQDGSFHLDVSDLSVGQAAPRGFSFDRHYSSNRRYTNEAQIAHGWTHNYMMKAAERSDAAAAHGLATPQQAASMLVATHAVRTILSSTTITSEPLRWAMAALIAEWGVDQITNNAVSIQLGKDVMQFIKQPGGSFTPPAGVTMTLTKGLEGYKLEERHGNTFNFDASTKRIKTIVDRYGKTMAFSYLQDSGGLRLSTVTDGWGNNARTLTLSYTILNGEASPRLSSISDGLGHSVQFGYALTPGSSGLDLTAVTDATGNIWRYEYDSEHKILKSREPTGSQLGAVARVIVQNNYDSNGKVIQQYSEGNPLNVTSFYVTGRETVEKDAVGARKLSYYDERARCYATFDPNRNMTSVFYDGQDHVITQQTPKGERSYFVYDGRNNLLESQDRRGESEYRSYDSLDRLWTVTDKNGFDTTFHYSPVYVLLVDQVTRPFGFGGSVTESFEYYPDGSLKKKTDPAQNDTNFDYDFWGNLKTITPPAIADPPSGAVNMEYYPTGDLQKLTDENGLITDYTYNGRRQLTTTTINLTTGNQVSRIQYVSTIQYDNSGNVWKKIDPNQNTTEYTYSADGRLLETKLPAVVPYGQTVAVFPIIKRQYDERNLLKTLEDPRNKIVTYGYDLPGRLNSVIDQLLRETKCDFDLNSQKKWTQSSLTPQVQKTSYDYTERGELKTMTDAAGFPVSYQYDPNGNQTLVRNRNAGDFVTTYYDDNRVYTTAVPSTKKTTYAYNSRGLVQSITEHSGDKAIFDTYDARGRLTQMHYESGATTVASEAYTYDAIANIDTHTEGSTTITRVYDTLKRVKSYSFADTANPTRNYTIQYAYDSNGNLKEITYPGGVKKVTYQYTSHNLLWKVTDWANRTTEYQYDLADRLKKVLRPNNSQRTIEYSDAGEVLEIREISPGGGPIGYWKYKYDTGGRRQSEFVAPLPLPYQEPQHTMTYDADNRIQTIKLGTGVASSPIYDPDGNMTTGPSTTSVSGGSYVYDSRNRLISYTASSQTTQYVYDSEGNRIAMSSPGQTAVYNVSPLGDLSEVLVRIKADASKTFYVYGDGLLYEDDDQGNTKTYHYDSRGSTTALTDGSGAVVCRVEYTPYGKMIVRSGSTDTPFLFNGHYGVMTDANGLCHMRARYYNPYIRRFINPDPSGLTGGLNFYSYADGNPIDAMDPMGLSAIGEANVPSWLDTSRKSDFVTGFEKGLRRWAEGVPEDRYAANGSAGYQEGLRVGYAFVPGVLDFASLVLTLPSGGAAGGAARAVGGAATRTAGREALAGGAKAASTAARGAAKTAAKSAGQLGREGEALASQITGAAKNTESWVVNGRARIPDQVLAQDILTRNPSLITEVKNVQYQSLTRQLRDYADLVGPGGRVNVALPPGARVSGPLQRAFSDPFNPLNRIDLVPPR